MNYDPCKKIKIKIFTGRDGENSCCIKRNAKGNPSG